MLLFLILTSPSPFHLPSLSNHNALDPADLLFLDVVWNAIRSVLKASTP